MNIFSDIILSASSVIANIQGLVATEEAKIVEATAGIEAAQGRTVEVQQQAVSEITNAAQEGTQATVKSMSPEELKDEVIFIDNGKIILQSDADELRNRENASIDDIFRRMFKC